jgi:methylated-DNA-[protein]-cysteine S-methyltransferase
MDSPIGPLRLAADGPALCEIRFGADPADAGRGGPVAPVLTAARDQLAAYFAGALREFDLPLAPRGTAFQHRVWDHLLTIGWGATTTYGAIAAALGMPPGASRAVGAANGANPLPVVVPCHRVIGADGTLTGYAGGLDRKALLLRLERVPTEADQGALF